MEHFDKEQYQRKLDEVIKQHPVGSLIEGTVIRHMHFGVFVDIGHDPIIGLVRIVDFPDDYPMSPTRYPLQSTIKGVVLDVANGTVYIEVKSSHLAQAI